jgi:hypothetical protein
MESMLGNALLAEGSRTGLGAIYASTPNSIKRDGEDTLVLESPNEFHSNVVSQRLSLPPAALPRKITTGR